MPDDLIDMEDFWLDQMKRRSSWNHTIPSEDFTPEQYELWLECATEPELSGDYLRKETFELLQGVQ